MTPLLSAGAVPPRYLTRFPLSANLGNEENRLPKPGLIASSPTPAYHREQLRKIPHFLWPSMGRSFKCHMKRGSAPSDRFGNPDHRCNAALHVVVSRGPA